MTLSRARGRLIALEGGEGCGKSTQAALLRGWLEAHRVATLGARDPGGTPVAEAIRGLLLDPGWAPIAPVTELLLYAAARAQLVREVLEPALAAGRVVVLDRYEDSTYAYQGAGRGLPEPVVRAANDLATGGLRPDLVVVLDLAPAEGRRRHAVDPGRLGSDRMEREDAAFHERVREAYRTRAAAEPARYLVLDAGGPPDDIQRRVRDRVAAILGVQLPKELSQERS